MPHRFRLTMAQLNPTVGDLSGNADKVRSAWRKAKFAGADLVAFPEMFLTGYQPQDLVLKAAFTAHATRIMEELAQDCAGGPALAVGAPFADDPDLFNAYWILENGTVKARIRKRHLPNDAVFDERRLYDQGPITGPYCVGPLRIGSPVCEDAWFEEVPEALAESGAQILLVPNGSPYFRDKHGVRLNHMVARTVETGLPLVYLNMVGGQDDQVFDGASFVLNPHGVLAAQLPLLEEIVVHVDFEETETGWRAIDGDKSYLPDAYEQDYRVMVTALRDYVAKTGFSKVVLGLSGGVDSALVAAIAVDALGPGNVRCVMLPSEFTSTSSMRDADEIAQNLGCLIETVPISGAVAAVGEALSPLFEGRSVDVTEENVQSRLRGLLLMAVSNKFGEMLLTTGNKSELAVGYATIYGDMAGGYNPIKDLYKMRVFETCRWRNFNHRDWMKGPKGEVIPARVIDKPPSAELRAGQKDEDTLPRYEVLDGILEMLVDGDMGVEDVVAAGYDRATVKRVEHLIYTSEYKRFQSAPGPRLTGRALWLDRRYPIVNRWRDPGGK